MSHAVSIAHGGVTARYRDFSFDEIDKSPEIPIPSGTKDLWQDPLPSCAGGQ